MLNVLDQLTVFALWFDLFLTVFGAVVCLFWLTVFTSAPLARLAAWAARRVRAARLERRSS